MTTPKCKQCAALERENTILRNAAKELQWMARRYATGRATYAPGMCNNATESLLRLGMDIDLDSDLTNGPKTVWATDATIPLEPKYADDPTGETFKPKAVGT